MDWGSARPVYPRRIGGLVPQAAAPAQPYTPAATAIMAADMAVRPVTHIGWQQLRLAATTAGRASRSGLLPRPRRGTLTAFVLYGCDLIGTLQRWRAERANLLAVPGMR